MIKFKSVQAIPLSKLPAKVLVRWEMDVKSDADLKDYEFLVLRQHGGQDARPGHQHVDIDGKPLTPAPEATESRALSPISTWIDGLDFPWHVDYADSLKNLSSRSFYKVKCRHKQTQEEVESDEVSWSGDLDLVGLYVVDEHNFLLRDSTGTPALIYQRRRGGVSCTACYDKIQKKRLSSSCNSCYGTNWVGGFFNPIDVYVDFTPNVKATQIAPWGEVQDNQTDILASNFPVLNPGDLIRELQAQRLWRVERVTPTEKRRCLMLQLARLVELKPGDVEWRIPTDERFQIKKVAELEQVKKKREF